MLLLEDLDVGNSIVSAQEKDSILKIHYEKIITKYEHVSNSSTSFSGNFLKGSTN